MWPVAPCFCWQTFTAVMGVSSGSANQARLSLLMPFSRCFVTARRQVSHPHPVISVFEPLHLQWTLSCQVSCPVCIHSDHAAFKAYETVCFVSLVYIHPCLLSAYIPFISSLHSNQTVLPKCIGVLFLPNFVCLYMNPKFPSQMWIPQGPLS